MELIARTRLISLVFTALILAACGGGSDGRSNSNPPTPTPQPPAGEVKFEFTVKFDATDLTLYYHLTWTAKNIGNVPYNNDNLPLSVARLELDNPNFQSEGEILNEQALTTSFGNLPDLASNESYSSGGGGSIDDGRYLRVCLLEFDKTIVACTPNYLAKADEGNIIEFEEVDSNAPRVNAGENQSVNERQQVTLSAEVLDSIGTVQYAWFQTSGTEIILSETTSSNLIFVAPDVDKVSLFSFEVIVTDSRNLESSDTVTISVSPFFQSLETKNVDFTESVFTANGIDINSLFISGLFDEKQVASGSIDLTTPEGGQTLFITDADETVIAPLFVDEESVTNSSFDITGNTIADGVLMMVPAMLNIDRQQRTTVLEFARSQPEYQTLVNSIVNGIISDPTGYLNPRKSLETWSMAIELVQEGINFAPTQVSKVSKVTLLKQSAQNSQSDSSLPNIQFSTSSRVLVENPTMIFYSYSFGGEKEHLIAGKEQAWEFGLWPPVRFSEASQEEISLNHGTYTVSLDANSPVAFSAQMARASCVLIDIIAWCPVDAATIEELWEIDPLDFGIGVVIDSLSIEELFSAIVTYMNNNPEQADRLIKKLFKKVGKRASKKSLKAIAKFTGLGALATMIKDGTQVVIPMAWDMAFAKKQLSCSLNHAADAFDFDCGNMPPTANILLAQTGYVPLNTPVAFSANSSTDDFDTELEFRWDFNGDGHFDNDWNIANGNVSYEYNVPGQYDVVLQARDSEGLIGRSGMSIVTEPDNRPDRIQSSTLSDFYVDEGNGVLLQPEAQIYYGRCYYGQTFNTARQQCNGVAERLNFQELIDLNKTLENGWQVPSSPVDLFRTRYCTSTDRFNAACDRQIPENIPTVLDQAFPNATSERVITIAMLEGVSSPFALEFSEGEAVTYDLNERLPTRLIKRPEGTINRIYIGIDGRQDESIQITSSTHNASCSKASQTCPSIYQKGDVVTLVASGENFSHFSGECTSSVNVCEIMVSRDTAVIAHYSYPEQKSLTVERVGNGIVLSSPSSIHCGSSCTGTFDAGTRVILDAFADDGNEFFKWGGACSGTTPSCAIVLNNDTNVTAEFRNIDTQEALVYLNFTGMPSDASLDVNAQVHISNVLTLNATVDRNERVASTFSGPYNSGDSYTVDVVSIHGDSNYSCEPRIQSGTLSAGDNELYVDCKETDSTGGWPNYLDGFWTYKANDGAGTLIFDFSATNRSSGAEMTYEVFNYENYQPVLLGRCSFAITLESVDSSVVNVVTSTTDYECTERKVLFQGEVLKVTRLSQDRMDAFGYTHIRNVRP